MSDIYDEPESVKLVPGGGGLAPNGPWPDFESSLTEQRRFEPLPEAQEFETEERVSEPVEASPETHRQTALGHIDRGLHSLDQRARLTKQWASSIGYHHDVIDRIDQIIELVGETEKLISAHEGRL